MSIDRSGSINTSIDQLAIKANSINGCDYFILHQLDPDVFYLGEKSPHSAPARLNTTPPFNQQYLKNLSVLSSHSESITPRQNELDTPLNSPSNLESYVQLEENKEPKMNKFLYTQQETESVQKKSSFSEQNEFKTPFLFSSQKYQENVSNFSQHSNKTISEYTETESLSNSPRNLESDVQLEENKESEINKVIHTQHDIESIQKRFQNIFSLSIQENPQTISHFPQQSHNTNFEYPEPDSPFTESQKRVNASIDQALTKLVQQTKTCCTKFSNFARSVFRTTPRDTINHDKTE